MFKIKLLYIYIYSLYIKQQRGNKVTSFEQEQPLESVGDHTDKSSSKGDHERKT
jgi:hypothetical protein